VLQRALRIVVAAAAGVALIVAAAQLGRVPGLVAAGAVFGVGIALVWLPRAAHRAFRAGDSSRARLLYGVLRTVLVDPWARAAVDVSLAACEMAGERYREALAALERVDPTYLSEPARAAWLNNRAYALARLRERPEVALRCIGEAMDLRPQVAGFRHTRGIALLAVGRVDEAIRELDAVWRALPVEEESSLLESERCYDLGVAWSRKGESEYAADYFDRARRAAPQSPWAARAAVELDHREAPPDRSVALGDLL
jgi:tetratricopeptide (TPR) repeat protein